MPVGAIVVSHSKCPTIATTMDTKGIRHSSIKDPKLLEPHYRPCIIQIMPRDRYNNNPTGSLWTSSRASIGSEGSRRMQAAAAPAAAAAETAAAERAAAEEAAAEAKRALQQQEDESAKDRLDGATQA